MGHSRMKISGNTKRRPSPKDGARKTDKTRGGYFCNRMVYVVAPSEPTSVSAPPPTS